MGELNVRIVKLDPLRAARFHAYSASPEDDAWKKLVAWAEPRGMFQDRAAHRIYGFNNPNPSPGSPNYGYEFWITVEPGMEVEGGVEIVDFCGGLYAVAQSKGLERIGLTWQELVRWRESSPYRHGTHQWLENNLSEGTEVPPEELVLDLYLPITE
jgi:DNA gyrase inhibitor GyrI